MAVLISSSLLTRERSLPHRVFPHQTRSPPGARVGVHPLGADCVGAPRFPGRPPPYPTEPLAGGRRLQDRTQSAALEQDGERLPTPSNLQPPHGELLMLPMANETVDPQPVVARLIPATITFPPSQMRVRTPRCSTATESGSSNRFSRD